ncbi:MAG: RagB/SusD family nutrient uptake outer membrane protein, partial [Cyclobacteriaceae bacterium]|nr:RagB/SusD family nutrient uptake outer membrane protein [Cyclobacteriaceae bacterium]
AEIANIGRMFQGTTPDNSGVLGHYWNTYYKIIERSNALIRSAETIKGIDEAKRIQILSEAKFFRANSVFILYRTFNNIYITTEPTNFENAFNLINQVTPADEIFKLVKDDLAFSITNLPWTNTQVGRITQGTARHVKAEVALWQSDWAEAKLQAEAVIDPTLVGGPAAVHTLVASTGNVFRGDQNHKEALWNIQWKVLVNGTPHKINFNLMPNYAENMAGSKYTIEQSGRGFSWLTLNNYLRNLLAADPNDTRIKGNYYIKDYVYNDAATIAGATAAPYLPVGVPKNLGDKIARTDHDEFGSTAASRNNFFIRLNAGCKKYFPDDGNPTVDNQTKNIMVYRLAETFLFAAEANMMLGNIGTSGDAATARTALGQLNAVRKRAATTALSAITLQDILDEQARELAFEGKRWYMLKRTGKLYDYIVDHAGYGAPGDLALENAAVNTKTGVAHDNTPANPFTYRNDARRGMKAHFVNWPIPTNIKTLLGPSYPQNTGY